MLNYDFITNDSRIRPAVLANVEDDARAARLSRAFRAYYLLRPIIPIRLRQMLQQRRKFVAPDGWYTPDRFMSEFTECLRSAEDLQTIHPWPSGAQFAFVLTHDVETQDGVKLIDRLAKIEEQLGFRSSWNIVPYKYQVDKSFAADLKSRGFEIGIHGYNHDGRLYWSKRVFQKRVTAINAALHDFGAVGFRSPMVHRNLEWLQSLQIEYDSSCFDVDPYQAMPGGVGAIWPFIAGRFVELPYTLPQDHTVFIVRGERDTHTWSDKLDFLAKNHGMALMLTHPDYLTSQRNLDLYRDFLKSVQDRGGYWHALPKEVARWWNERSDCEHRLVDQHHSKTPGSVSEYAMPARLSASDENVSFLPLSTVNR